MILSTPILDLSQDRRDGSTSGAVRFRDRLCGSGTSWRPAPATKDPGKLAFMTSRTSALLIALTLAATPASAQRLPKTVVPDHYDLSFTVDLEHARFEGTETIRVQVAEATRTIVLNAVDIEFHEATA